MKNNRFAQLFFIIFTGIFPITLLGQTFPVSGVIRDQSTNEPLGFANVEVLGQSIGTSAGENGQFSLSLANGDYQLQFSFIGYKTETAPITVADGGKTLSIALIPTGVLLQEVTVYTNPGDGEAAQVSSTSLQSERVREISSIVPDVMRSIQALPGISANNEFSAKFNVRGGNFDENLVLVNGAQVYEPFHVKEADNASIGIFNVDLMRKVDLMTGGFSARYGDRASSVLNIEYREGNRERYTGAATLSMTNLDGYIEGPLSSRGSFILGLRKSYLEYVLAMLDVEDGARPSFYDIQGVTSFYITPKNKLLFEFIHAGDDFRIDPQIETIGPFTGTGTVQGEPANLTETRYDEENEKARYFSNLFDLQSVNFIGKNLLLRTEVSYYDQLEEERYHEIFNRNVAIEASQNYFYRVDVDDIEENDLRIKTLEMKSDIDAQIHPFHQLKAGISYQDIRYRQDQVDRETIVERFDFEDYPDTTVNVIDNNYIDPADQQIRADSYKLAGYLEDVWQASDKLLLSIGGRADYFDINRDLNISPRISASYSGLGEWTVRGAWGHYYQSPIYRQIASPVASDTNTQAIRATHYILSLERGFLLKTGNGSDNLKLRIESYYKDYDDLIHSEIGGDGNIFYTRRNDATGFVKGIDLHAVLSMKRFYGWLSYGLLSAKEDLIDDNRGAFPRYTDQRHTLSAVGDMQLGSGWKFNFRAFYGSGFAYTPLVPEFDTDADRWIWEEGDINSEHLPPYKRLDVRLSREFAMGNARMVAFLDVSNVLNFKNIYGYSYRFTRQELPNREEVELWPIVPSLGLTVKM